MTIRNDIPCRVLVGAMFMLPPVFAASAQAPGAVGPGVTSTNPVASVDPRVPRAAGRPCVVELLHQRPWPQQDAYIDIDPNIIYMPPVSCPPPWAKIILKIDMRTTRRSVLDTLGMDLAHVRLFRSATPRYDGLSSWHVERDLTDYSALFRVPHTGRIWSTANPEAVDWDWVDHLPTYNADAQLLFYPASAATPAPRVPDRVVAVNQDTPANLPHNIVRAYLDVENDFLPSEPLWFTCVSNDTTLPMGDVFAPGTIPKSGNNPPDQGCGGGSFREIQVKVDGTLAGTAPVFPLVIADLNWYHRNSADLPIPTLEMLNFKPFRIDLSPFAAVLSAPGPHFVTSTNRVDDDSRDGGNALLLYLDRGRVQVTGAVTRNTLATENGAPTDINTLHRSGDTISGDIKTVDLRDYVIQGFVDTSRGRIYSSAWQTNVFTTTQDFHLVGPQRPDDEADKLYSQNVWLNSDVRQASRRTFSGARTISDDVVTTSYPLQLHYDIATHVIVDAGWAIDFKRTNVTVLQSRVVEADHYRPGVGHFLTHAGSRFYSVNRGGIQQTNPQWESYTTRNYKDNFGSCYSGELSARGGAIVRMVKGTTCPCGRNQVRWFAHPDGSPDSLGWWH